MKKSWVRKLAIAGAGLVMGGLLAWFWPAKAAVRCESQYGYGETCVKTGELQINKEVWDKANVRWVDNLTVGDYKFYSGEEVVFQLKIKNVGDEKFDKVQVTDTLPEHLELTSGETSFEISDLDVDEEVVREIKAKVEQLPEDKSVICEVNAAEAKSGDEHDRDTAQVCMEQKVLGVATLPSTGPVDGIELLAATLALGGAGLFFIRVSRV